MRCRGLVSLALLVAALAGKPEVEGGYCWRRRSSSEHYSPEMLGLNAHLIRFPGLSLCRGCCHIRECLEDAARGVKVLAPLAHHQLGFRLWPTISYRYALTLQTVSRCTTPRWWYSLCLEQGNNIYKSCSRSRTTSCAHHVWPAHGGGDDQGSLWVIKEGQANAAAEAGEPVMCGSTIRLGHLQTERNLHSHLFHSPLSGQQEVGPRHI